MFTPNCQPSGRTSLNRLEMTYVRSSVAHLSCYKFPLQIIYNFFSNDRVYIWLSKFRCQEECCSSLLTIFGTRNPLSIIFKTIITAGWLCTLKRCLLVQHQYLSFTCRVLRLTVILIVFIQLNMTKVQYGLMLNKKYSLFGGSV